MHSAPCFGAQPGARGDGELARGLSLVQLSRKYIGRAEHLTHSPVYLTLDADDTSPQQAYASLVAEALNPDDVALIRLRLQRQHALGTDRFRSVIEAQLQRRAGPAKIGRPCKDRPGPESGMESPL